MDRSLPDLTGTVALVTGAAGGIGGGVADRFAAAGAAVVVHHRSGAERAAAVAAGIVERGGRAIAVRADVTDAAACAALMGTAVNTVSPGLVHRIGLESAWPDGVASWRRAAPLGRLGEPSDVGDACVFLASPMARWITGHDLVVDGGMSVAPSW